MTLTGVVLTKKAKVTEEHRGEATLLRAIWNVKKPCTQAEFGEQYEIGNQSAVGQFLRGDAPLSLKAALGFSRGLGVPIASFSLRLAKEADSVVQVSADTNPSAVSRWPFKTVTPAQYANQLTDQNRATIEAMVLQLVQANEPATKQAQPAQEVGAYKAA